MPRWWQTRSANILPAPTPDAGSQQHGLSSTTSRLKTLSEHLEALGHDQAEISIIMDPQKFWPINYGGVSIKPKIMESPIIKTKSILRGRGASGSIKAESTGLAETVQGSGKRLGIHHRQWETPDCFGPQDIFGAKFEFMEISVIIKKKFNHKSS